MRTGWRSWAGLWALLSVGWAAADTGANPYASIVARNIFNLREPPPPATNLPPPPPPPAPMPTVKLKGITSILSTKRAILEITDPAKKGSPESRILEEGDRLDSVEVLTIDPVQDFVKVRIGDTVTNLTFEKVEAGKTAAATPGAPAPGTVPVFRPPGTPTPGVTTPGAVPTATTLGVPGTAAGSGGSSVFIMGAGGSSTPAAGGSGVLTFGASPSTPASPSIPTLPTRVPTPGAPSLTPGSTTVSPTPGAPVVTPPGVRTIPTREIRTDTQPRSSSTLPTLTPEQHTLLLDLNRIANEGKGFPPIPGPSFLNLDQPSTPQPQQTAQPATPQVPGLPQAPRPPGFPQPPGAP